MLVGGEGTRLRPLTLTTPKQMLPVAGRPMIERVVAHLADHGVDDVVLSLGYRPDAFRDAYPTGRCAGARLVYAVEDHPLDTAGAVAFAAREAGIDDTFVVLNGDVLTNLDVAALVSFHRSRAATASIALAAVDDPSAFGVVVTDRDGRVREFVEKPPRDKAPSNLVNVGVYVLDPAVLDRIPPGRRVSIERETFPALVAEQALFALPSEASWLDVGTPAKYLASNLELGAVDGGVSDADVCHSVLGEHVEIGAGATVERSVLHDGVRVGKGATVRGSIVGAGAIIGEGAQVEGLTVLGSGVAVEPGRHLSGERLPAVPAAGAAATGTAQ